MITTLSGEADEATKLEYSASDIEKCTVEKDAVDAKGEAAKDWKIGTNTRMEKYLRCDKCGKCLSLIPALLNQFTGATREILLGMVIHVTPGHWKFRIAMCTISGKFKQK